MRLRLKLRKRCCKIKFFSLFLPHLLEYRFRIRGNGKKQSKDSYPLRNVLRHFMRLQIKPVRGKIRKNILILKCSPNASGATGMFGGGLSRFINPCKRPLHFLIRCVLQVLNYLYQRVFNGFYMHGVHYGNNQGYQSDNSYHNQPNLYCRQFPVKPWRPGACHRSGALRERRSRLCGGLLGRLQGSGRGIFFRA